MVLNSVIFHTQKLREVRNFYIELLGMRIAMFEQDGRPALDESANHVNFDLNGSLLCFEIDEDRLDRGTMVLKVESLEAMKARLRKSGVPLGRETSHFILVEDPEGREIILEENEDPAIF